MIPVLVTRARVKPPATNSMIMIRRALLDTLDFFVDLCGNFTMNQGLINHNLFENVDVVKGLSRAKDNRRKWIIRYYYGKPCLFTKQLVQIF